MCFDKISLPGLRVVEIFCGISSSFSFFSGGKFVTFGISSIILMMYFRDFGSITLFGAHLLVALEN